MARKHGKVIQTESIYIAGTRIEVQLRLVREETSLGGVGQFFYLVNHDSPKVYVRHEDPRECLKLAKEELETLLAIKWKPMLHIVVQTSDTWRHATWLLHGHLDITVTEYDVGMRGEEPVYRGSRRDEDSIRQGTPLTDERHRNEDSRDSEALIPDTPLARVQLKVIVDSLTTLAHRVSALLAPPKIASTLANVKVLALPAPEKPKRKVKRGS
mgnify:CR=1 FL=1